MKKMNREFNKLMKQLGWSKAEAARQLMVDPSTVSRYCSGENQPDAIVMKLLRLMAGTEL